MDRDTYLTEDSWHGSYFELALQIGPAGDDRVAEQALHALWRQPELRGPWLAKDEFGSEPIAPSLSHYSLYGCLKFGDVELGCMSYFIREEPGSDWLDLSIPTGMFELAFPVSYPLDTQTNPWLAKVERVLATIGARIFEATPFELGLLGEEASGASSASELSAVECERGGLLVPAPLWEALSPGRVPELIAPGLVYAPYAGPHISYGG
jgi:hypothetical protein